MSSNVFSKVRCLSPNYKETPIKNYKHTFYISNRKYCLKNEFGKSLFGYIYDYENIDKTNNTEIANYIYNKSKKGTNIYRGIVSLAEKDAIHQGLLELKDWKRIFYGSIYEISEKLNIPFSRAEWIATVHYKKGNPHLHYLIWDKDQKIKDSFITVNTQNKIKNILRKNIYKDQYLNLIENKNEAKQNLRKKEILREFKAIDKKFCNGKIAYINIDKKVIKELKEDINTIRRMIPKNGRLNYAFMSEEMKNSIDNFINKVIEHNYDFKLSYQNYIKSYEEISNFFREVYKEERIEKADMEAHRILGNQLLHYIKDKLYLEYSIENIIQQMYYVLTQMEDSENNFLQTYVFNKDLSLYAKKEYIFKNKFSNYWEREM